jgi:Ca2+-binding RTX toxin-like protein
MQGELLERRTLFNIDLTISYTLGAQTPYYISPSPGADLSITVKNDGSSNADLPIAVAVYLSKNRKLEPSIDETVGDVIIQSLKSGKSNTQVDQMNAGGVTPGKYYIIAQVDTAGLYSGSQNPFADSNPADNVFISATPDVVIFPQWLAGLRDGTAAKDVLSFQQNETHQIITLNGEVFATEIGTMGFYQFLLGASPDKVSTESDFTTPLRISGGGGNDTIVTGAGIDEISGSGGRDKLYGQNGDDYLIGGGANDYLEGGAGDDTLSGGVGNDKLVGLTGADSILGGVGDDQLYSKGDGIDTLSGGPGTDLGDYDSNDIKAGIEGVIA